MEDCGEAQAELWVREYGVYEAEDGFGLWAVAGGDVFLHGDVMGEEGELVVCQGVEVDWWIGGSVSGLGREV